ncbi:phospholipid transfer protein C2CD2L [Bombina bombina]|uniref:phospholipid transfer protein C2CD2L n=1 Tax=Bombina bombina TaxID=8345 RepID=UPI00235A553E|nr:phospholipid transfer protein C2CD2L [Bombina bombina]
MMELPPPEPGLPASPPTLPGMSSLSSAVMLVLFAASLFTVLAWLIQVTRRFRAAAPPAPGARSLLTALCGFPSVRDSWGRAWARALNQEAARSRGSVQLQFEESTHLQPNPHISHVICTEQSHNQMAFICHLSADTVRFPVTVTQESPAAVSMETYQVSLTLHQAQMEVRLQELPQEGLLMSWGFRERPNITLEVTSRQSHQSHEGGADLCTVQELIEDALLSAQPAMVFNLKARDGDMGLCDRLLRSSPSRPEAPKLLVRQLQLEDVILPQTEVELRCEAELDYPWQRCETIGVRTQNRGSACNLSWSEEMTFDFTAQSKELSLKVWQIRSTEGNLLLGHTSVVLGSSRKELCGRHIYSLIPSSSQCKISIPTISLEFLIIEPSIPRMTLGATPQRLNITPTKKVEMDRTVMPDGTIVTTVTTIQSRPRLDGMIDSPSRSPSKVEVTEKKPVVLSQSCSPVSSLSGSGGSPSSLKLDPVAETAIRQLTEPSNKPAKKTPTKRSTLIISGVSKVPIDHDEMALSLGYAASMDASMQSCSMQGQDPLLHASSDPLSSEITTPYGPDTDDTTRSDVSDRPSVEDLESETGSVGTLETRSLKDHKMGFLRSGTKLLFRRRHRDPGLSQSHSDLTDTASASLKKSGSFSRRLLKRFSLKSKSKPNANGSTIVGDK